MKLSRFSACAVLTAVSALGQGLLETIRTPDRAVPVVELEHWKGYGWWKSRVPEHKGRDSPS